MGEYDLEMSEYGLDRNQTVEQEFSQADEIRRELGRLRDLIPNRLASFYDESPKGLEEYENVHDDSRPPDMEGLLMYDLPDLYEKVRRLSDNHDKKEIFEEIKNTEAEILKLYPYYFSHKVTELGYNAERNDYKMNEDEAEYLRSQIIDARNKIEKTKFTENENKNLDAQKEILARITDIEERLKKYTEDPVNFAVDYYGYRAEKEMNKMVNLATYIFEKRSKIGSESLEDMFDEEQVELVKSIVRQMERAKKYTDNEDVLAELNDKISYVEEIIKSPEIVEKIREKYIQAEAQVDWLKDNKNEDFSEIKKVYDDVMKVFKDAEKEVEKFRSFSIRHKILDKFLYLYCSLLSTKRGEQEFREIFREEGVDSYEKNNEAYEVLGLKMGASPEEIKKRYKIRARETHPDTGGSDEDFRKVNEAYNILKKARLAY